MSIFVRLNFFGIVLLILEWLFLKPKGMPVAYGFYLPLALSPFNLGYHWAMCYHLDFCGKQLLVLIGSLCLAHSWSSTLALGLFEYNKVDSARPLSPH